MGFGAISHQQGLRSRRGAHQPGCNWPSPVKPGRNLWEDELEPSLANPGLNPPRRAGLAGTSLARLHFAFLHPPGSPRDAGDGDADFGVLGSAAAFTC